MIKAILFDLNDTLIYRDSKKSNTSIQKKLELINDPRATKDWLKETRKKYFFELSTGAMDDKEYWTLALAELGINNEKLVDDILKVHSGAGCVFEDVKPALQLAREKGLLIGILANSSAGNEDTVNKLLGGLFDAASYSHLTGFRKPHRKAYLSLCDVLKVKPEECVFVSDEIYEDLWGAKRLGMKTAWVKRENRDGYFHVDPNWQIIKPNLQATNLTEIIKQIAKNIEKSN